jgi:hypothetical protein
MISKNFATTTKFHVYTKVNKSSSFILFSKWTSFFLQILAISLDVLDHQIFASQFIMIRKVTDDSKVSKHSKNIRSSYSGCFSLKTWLMYFTQDLT